MDERIEKPMDIFGNNWQNHWERIAADWSERVTEKDTVLIDSEQEVRTFELAEKKAAVSTPLLKRMLDSNEDTAVFTLVSTAVMLLFLLAGILILIRIYWRQKK